MSLPPDWLPGPPITLLSVGCGQSRDPVGREFILLLCSEPFKALTSTGIKN
jgi:hypothetical protein